MIAKKMTPAMKLEHGVPRQDESKMGRDVNSTNTLCELAGIHVNYIAIFM